MASADQLRGYLVDARGSDPSTLPQGSFDWQDAVLQTGRINNYDASMSGGTDKTQYYVSGNFVDQSNYVIGNEANRISGRLNLKQSVTDKLRFGVNVGLSRVDNDRIASDNSTAAPLTSSYLQRPWVVPFDDNGNFVNTGFIQNVLALEALSVRNLINRRTNGNIYAMYDIVPGLTFKTEFGIDEIQTEETQRDPEIVSPGGSGYRRIFRDNKWLTNNSLSFDRDFGRSNLSLLGLISYETSQLETTAIAGSDFAADNLRNIASAATPTITFASRTAWALFSQVFRASYRFDDKYLLEGTVRRDGSSRFGADNQYGVFWAGSIGWIATEDIFQNSESLDYLKFSLSYGTTGNDRIGNFASLGLYQSGVDSDYDGLPGIRPTQAANPALSWEESAQVDFGISSAWFNNRLSANINVWNKNTTQLLLDFNLPEVLGISTISQNAGEMRNTGVDFDLRATVAQRGDFEWRVNFNTAWLQNEILELPGAPLDDEGRPFLQGTASQRAIVGHSANTFYLTRYNGINENGEAEWLDKEGNVTTNYGGTADRVIVGSAIPDFTGGITNIFRYKDLDFSFFFNYVYGNEVYLGELRFTENTAAPFNISERLLDYWTPQNTDGVVPNPDGGNNFLNYGQRSTNQLMDGSFLRLRNVTLGYTFRGDAFNTNAFNTVRAYVLGQNLLTITNPDFRGQDPEVNDGGAGENLQFGESFFTPPQARTITIGINASF
jgi:TonB-linked SusC/RagA family outer membrane protein